MRYGENIDEVLAKPHWVCPVCRDLCNCSNHRIRKGWRPTGTLYRYVIEQGMLCVHGRLIRCARSTCRLQVGGALPGAVQPG